MVEPVAGREQSKMMSLQYKKEAINQHNFLESYDANQSVIISFKISTATTKASIFR